MDVMNEARTMWGDRLVLRRVLLRGSWYSFCLECGERRIDRQSTDVWPWWLQHTKECPALSESELDGSAGEGVPARWVDIEA